MSDNTLSLVLIVSISAIVSNLLIALLCVNDQWSPLMTVFTIAADVVLSIATVAVGGTGLVWVGLVPIAATGFYFDWRSSLIVGSIVATGMVAVELLQSTAGDLNVPVLLLTLTALPAAGPLTALLTEDETEVAALRLRGRRAEQITKLATEYMGVVYEMAEVLSASKLDPKRVLDSAVNFGVEGLLRVGVKPYLYGAILLFDESEEGMEPVLRVGDVSDSVPPSDRNIVAPGLSGAIGEALRKLEPAISRAPQNDPELRYFTSFSACRTVLCLPLRAGDEVYGVMVVGSEESNAFKEIHIELMRAVANMAAASIRNARLYVSLREQRDRMAIVEKTARAQLASELHDGPTQTVAAITMRLNFIRKLIEKKPETALDELYRIEDMARRTSKEIRAILFELRPKALDQGLKAGLKQLADKMQETYDQNVELVVENHSDELLDAQTTLTIFAFVTEAVHNARKHASAEQIKIHVGVREDTFLVEVSDNGVGFDVEKAFAEAHQREGHLGLLNLQERAALLEGTLHVDSSPGQGTRISLLIPLEVIRHRKLEEMRRKADEARKAEVAAQ
ncbi:MAG TPA: GAF domain-containing protein [Chloroflexi bacterium]|nr:GAF domain-containing protein [Chloroflexota bacterium]